MSRELIERIDQEIQNLMGQRDVIERLLPNNTAVRELTQIIKVLMDCKAALLGPVASVPQDVEEFIAAHDYDKEDMCSGCVPSSALREWMAGHARVPVDDLDDLIWLTENPMRVREANSKARRAIIKCRKAMLTASKERTESIEASQEGV